MMTSRILCALACLLCALVGVQGSVMGIDFGSEFIKVAAVRPGTPFHIVVDEQSKRKVPAIVGFGKEERVFGNSAVTLAGRKPNRAFLWAHTLLGKKLDCPEVRALQEQGYPYEFVEDEVSGGVAVKMDNYTFTPVHLVAMSLEHIKALVEVDLERPSKDAVITVPPFWGQKERQAMLDAAALAGLKVLSLVNENTAFAIQYGIDREYSVNETHTAVFYNMGSTSTKTTVALYSGYESRKGRKNQTIGQFEVTGLGYDSLLGGRAFDNLIVNYLADELQAQLRDQGDDLDVRTHLRVMSKLRTAAKKAKKVLSANNETPVFITSVYNDMDFKAHITRAQFNDMAASLLDRVVAPLESALDQAGLTKDEIDSLVIIGGCTRIPGVQARLKEYLERDTLGMNLNGDEGAALGAVSHAANLSAQFKVRPLRMHDISAHSVRIEITDLPRENATMPVADDDAAAAAAADAAGDGEEESDENKPFVKKGKVFSRGNRLGFPGTKAKSVKKFNHTVDLRAVLSHEQSELREGTTAPIVKYNITGMDAVLSDEKYQALLETQDPAVRLSVRLDSSGIVRLVKAQATLEEMVKVPVAKKAKKKVEEPAPAADEAAAAASDGNEDKGADDAAKADAEGANEDSKAAEADQNGDADADADAASDEKPAEEPVEKAEEEAQGEQEEAADEEEPEFVEKKVTHRVPLKISVAGVEGEVQPYTKKMLREARKLLGELQARDDLKKLIAANKNNLESFIYGTRSDLMEEEWEEVSTEEEREVATEALREAEDWLYDQADDEPTKFVTKLEELDALVKDIRLRAEEAAARPQAVEDFEGLANATRELVAKWDEEKPWLNKNDTAKLLGQVDKVEEWLAEKQVEQGALKPHENPAFMAHELYAKMREISEQANKLARRRKPYEKPKKKKKTKKGKKGKKTKAEDGTEEGDAAAAAAATTEEGETAEGQEVKVEQQQGEGEAEGEQAAGNEQQQQQQQQQEAEQTQEQETAEEQEQAEEPAAAEEPEPKDEL